ncbi:hypothetical protein D9M69_597860 [compost metagenome]
MTQYRCDIDDRTGLALGNKPHRHALRDEERTGQVGVQQRRPLIAAHFLERRRAGKTRIVHQHIDMVELTLDGIETAFDGFGIGHVHGTGEGFAAGGADLRRHLFHPLDPARHTGHLRTGLRQHAGEMRAQAGAGPRHQCDSALQAESLLCLADRLLAGHMAFPELCSSAGLASWLARWRQNRAASAPLITRWS